MAGLVGNRPLCPHPSSTQCRSPLHAAFCTRRPAPSDNNKPALHSATANMDLDVAAYSWLRSGLGAKMQMWPLVCQDIIWLMSHCVRPAGRPVDASPALATQRAAPCWHCRPTCCASAAAIRFAVSGQWRPFRLLTSPRATPNNLLPSTRPGARADSLVASIWRQLRKSGEWMREQIKEQRPDLQNKSAPIDCKRREFRRSHLPKLAPLLPAFGGLLAERMVRSKTSRTRVAIKLQADPSFGRPQGSIHCAKWPNGNRREREREKANKQTTKGNLLKGCRRGRFYGEFAERNSNCRLLTGAGCLPSEER